jgi:hypothetical protein
MAAIDELFTGALVLAVPSHVEQQHRKAPGDQDGAGRGDHCD